MARSTLYYTPSVSTPENPAIMSEMDKLYSEDPTRGTRRMSKALLHKGFKLGRCKAPGLFEGLKADGFMVRFNPFYFNMNI
jgi:hypothetical protein